MIREANQRVNEKMRGCAKVEAGDTSAQNVAYTAKHSIEIYGNNYAQLHMSVVPVHRQHQKYGAL